MNARTYLDVFVVFCIATMVLTACAKTGTSAAKSDVDMSIDVAIYSLSETDSAQTSVYPCLMEERVTVQSLCRYADDDNSVTVPFYFSDKKRYEEITRQHIGKRIAISINGQIVSTPVVQMAIENGACSVVLDDSQLATFFY